MLVVGEEAGRAILFLKPANSAPRPTTAQASLFAGAENTSEMKKILGTTGSYNPRKFELQLVAIAKEMVAENPEIGAILLECTELPPPARAVQKAAKASVGLPEHGELDSRRSGSPKLRWIPLGVLRVAV